MGPVELRLSVVYSPRAGEIDEIQLHLAPGATVAQALVSSGFLTRYPVIDAAQLIVGIWGVVCAREQMLRESDRVEIYRPLLVDPKEARRQRYKAQGKKPRR
jgi:uncharacterized protein